MKTAMTAASNWSTERAQFFSAIKPDYFKQPTLQKLNELGYEILLHLPFSPDLSPANYSFFRYLNNFL